LKSEAAGAGVLDLEAARPSPQDHRGSRKCQRQQTGALLFCGPAVCSPAADLVQQSNFKIKPNHKNSLLCAIGALC
jgi:hypothetical protein